MDDAQITAEQLKAALDGQFDVLCEEVADAMNRAAAGRIIADSEEPVRDAHAVFRKQAYQKAIDLLQDRQEAFSPSARRVGEQGQADDHAPDDQRSD